VAGVDYSVDRGPVSVIGTFAVMHVFGFSINALTFCLGWCWRSAIVVDDAIVVVENVERISRKVVAKRRRLPGHA